MNNSGILLLHKASGITSARALTQAKRRLDIRKAGHGGTLDPLASGLLILLFGEATRYAGYLLGGEKQYTAVVHFGYRSDSDDADGTLTAGMPPPPAPLLRQRLAAALPDFCGDIQQRVPAYSAIKVAGKRLYHYARRGEDTPVKTRSVHIAAITLLAVKDDCATLSVRCGGGVYIRSLARDLGETLGCGAYLRALERVTCGKYRLADAVSLNTLEDAPPAVCRRRMLPIESVVATLPALTLPEQAIFQLGNGKRLAQPPPLAAPPLRIHSPTGTFAGLAEYTDGCYRPLNFLAWTRQAASV